MCETCKVSVFLRTAPSHVSIPQIKMARWPKTDKYGGEVLRKIQPYERDYEIAFVLRRDARMCEYNSHLAA